MGITKIEKAMDKTIEDYITEIWENYREDLTPSEKANITKYAKTISNVNSEYLGKMLAVILWTQDVKRLKGLE